MSNARRLSRIFGEDGRSVILALDAPQAVADRADVDRAASLVPTMVSHGLDAVLVPKGMAVRKYAYFRGVAMVLRCDMSRDPFDGTVPGSFMVNTALDAVQVGADGVVCLSFPGSDPADYVPLQDAVQLLGRDCTSYGLPLIVEALPFSFTGVAAAHRDPRNVATAARLAADLGADIVKTRYSGQPDDEEIAAAATVPVVALGGPKADLQGYLEFVRHCIDAGAAGVAVGRNVVQDPKPVAKIAALAAIVHSGATASEATALYHDIDA